MAGIGEYARELISQKNKLANNLNAMGVEANTTETLNTLVPKVLEINNTGSSLGIDKKLYSFGVLSDVHLRDTSLGGVDLTNSLEKYQKALDFYSQNDIDTICIAGDILAHNRNYATPDNPHPPNYTEESERLWINEILLYKNFRENFNGEIYTCTGNHDIWANGYSEPQPYGYTPIGMNQVITTQHPEYAAYRGKTCAEIWQEEISPLNFVFEKNGDVFIFFSMYYWNYANFCRPQDITWLSNQLNLHKNKRVFLFQHLLAPGVYDDPNPSGLILNAGTRAAEFMNIIKQHPNVIWFNGHSHYTLNLEQTFDNPNTYYKNGEAFHIHCSSLAYTRHEGTPYKDMYNESEGYVVDVYENKVVINGVDFTKNVNGELISFVKYVINK